MENTKLTLNVKSYSLPIVKKYAKSHSTSVSKLVQSFFDNIVEKEKQGEESLPEKFRNLEISENIKALTGILKGKYPDDITLWDTKYEYLKEKHGL